MVAKNVHRLISTKTLAHYLLDRNPRTQAPTQGREKGKVNDRQKTRTIITDPQLGTPTQGAKSRGKSQKSRDSDSTGPPLQTEAHIGTTRSKLAIIIRQHPNPTLPTAHPTGLMTHSLTEPQSPARRMR